MDRLEAMSLLIEVVNKGSFSAAARSLRVPVKVDRRRVLFARRSKPLRVDAFAKLRVRGANIRQQLDGVRSCRHATQPRLVGVRDRGVGHHARHRRLGWEIRLDHPGTPAALLLELERELEQVAVHSCRRKQPTQALCCPHPLKSPITNKPPHDGAVLLLNPGLVIFAIRARTRYLQSLRAAPVHDQLVHE